MNPLLHWIFPYNFTVILRRLKARMQGRVTGKRPVQPKSLAPVSWSELVDLLVEQGCDRSQVQEGSIPESSLESIVAILRAHFGPDLSKGLHIGNFVGVSLVFLTRHLMEINPQSVMVSIDPNIPHRNIHNPMQQVISLLVHAGVQKNSIILTGYSLEKSLSNDGLVYEAYDPKDAFNREGACENQLEQLSSLCSGQFDFAVIDGNHNGRYFAREVEWIAKLLRSGGLLIADDVSDTWFEVQYEYHRILGARFKEVFRDGRIGIIQKTD